MKRIYRPNLFFRGMSTVMTALVTVMTGMAGYMLVLMVISDEVHWLLKAVLLVMWCGLLFTWGGMVKNWLKIITSKVVIDEDGVHQRNFSTDYTVKYEDIVGVRCMNKAQTAYGISLRGIDDKGLMFMQIDKELAIEAVDYIEEMRRNSYGH